MSNKGNKGQQKTSITLYDVLKTTNQKNRVLTHEKMDTLKTTQQHKSY